MFAYFAGGCFWCITPTFLEMNGVKDVICGYCGGDEINPTYEEVKHQLTSHRETIRIEYDTDIIDYKKLLEVFINSVDPFDDSGQYIDRGYSYTLAIYYNDSNEKEITKNYLLEYEKKANRKVCISVEKLKIFYTAEEYHQYYYKKNPIDFEKELIESGRKNKK